MCSTVFKGHISGRPEPHGATELDAEDLHEPLGWVQRHDAVLDLVFKAKHKAIRR